MPTPSLLHHLARPLRTAALLLVAAATLLTGAVPAQAAETVTYFHHDAAGTPQLATDAAGNVLWKETYRPYGERIKREAGATSNNGLWFTGKPQDANSGLVYMGARYYEPVLGRFTGIDPAGVDEGNLHSFNRYAYGNNNPYKYVDPDGRNPVLIWMGVGAVTGGLTAGAMNAAVQYMATGQVDWGVYGVSGAAAEGAQMGMVFGPAGFAAGTRAGTGRAEAGTSQIGVVVTEDAIRAALKGSDMKTAQSAISKPAVENYVRRLEAGEVAPAIRVDGKVVVDGNHRYVAGRLVGREPAQTAGTLSPSQTGRVQPMQSLKIDANDWGNR